MKSAESRCIEALRHWFDGVESAFDAQPRQAITVVCIYHHIGSCDEQEAFHDEFGPSAEVFEAQVRFMLEHFDPIPPSEVGSDQGALDGSRHFAITFDDAYRDNLLVAAPILKRLGVPAAVFVPTGFIESSRTFWWEQLSKLIRRTALSGFRLDEQLAKRALESGLPAEYPLASVEHRQRTYASLSAALRSVSNEEIPLLLKRLAALMEVSLEEQEQSDSIMTWDELRLIRDYGFEIGAHTVGHVNLEMCDEATAKSEVLNSIDMLSKRLGEAPKIFAYPYGYFNEAAKAAVKSAGCESAFKVGSMLHRRGDDVFEIPRLPLPISVSDAELLVKAASLI